MKFCLGGEGIQEKIAFTLRRFICKETFCLCTFLFVATMLLAVFLPLVLKTEVLEGALAPPEEYYWVVYVDGEEAGLAEEKETIEKVLASIKEEAARSYGREVVMLEEISMEEESRAADIKEDLFALEFALRRTLSFKIEAFMLTVNGKDIVPLESEEAVEEVKELVQGAYLPQKDDARLMEVAIVETINSREVLTYPEELRSTEAAASILLEGTERRETYLVSRGDSLWDIAHEHELTVEELREANPKLEGDLLKIGEELSLIVADPIVNITTIEEVVEEENIPYATQYTDDSSMWTSQSRVVTEGELGRKEVTYIVTRENGKEVAREKRDEDVIEEPVTRVVARGTARAAYTSTGSFSWPVQGGGRLTSPYGWRSGRFHAGIDIAAPHGTPILAADGGVVVFSGRDGGYGNSIVIYHGYYYTRYAHNSQNLVSSGQSVSKGQKIATMGSTGRSTGTHLHFEIRTGGQYGSTINPLNYFSP